MTEEKSGQKIKQRGALDSSGFSNPLSNIRTGFHYLPIIIFIASFPYCSSVARSRLLFSNKTAETLESRRRPRRERNHIWADNVPLEWCTGDILGRWIYTLQLYRISDKSA